MVLLCLSLAVFTAAFAACGDDDDDSPIATAAGEQGGSTPAATEPSATMASEATEAVGRTAVQSPGSQVDTVRKTPHNSTSSLITNQHRSLKNSSR